MDLLDKDLLDIILSRKMDLLDIILFRKGVY